MTIIASDADQIQFAMALGYEQVPDEGAYMNAYYIKGGKKWIFNIIGLKKTLNVTTDDELREEGYDVDMYYEFQGYCGQNKSQYGESNDLIAIYDGMGGDGEDMYMEGGVYMTASGELREG